MSITKNSTDLKNGELLETQLLIDAGSQKYRPLGTIILLISCLNLGKSLYA